MIKKFLNILSIIFLGIGIIGIIASLSDLDIELFLFYFIWSLLGLLFCHLTRISDQDPKESSVEKDPVEEKFIEEESKKADLQNEHNEPEITGTKSAEENTTNNCSSTELHTEIHNDSEEKKSSVEISLDDLEDKKELQYEHSKHKWYIYGNYTHPETGERWSSKYIYNDVEVERIDPSFSEIFQYDSVDIVKESSTDHLITIKFFDKVLGYLKNTKIEEMANDYLNRNEEVHAQIEKMTDDTIFLRMFFCKKRAILYPPVDPITVKLVGNKSEMMQDNIDCCCEGDEIYVEKDWDKEKYLVWAGSYEIGYVPKSKQEYLEKLDMAGYEFGGEIIEISDIVKVKIQPQ